MIDVDKCGIEITRTNRKYGHCSCGVRVVKPGQYSKDTKLTVILAVEAGDPALQPEVQGSIQNPRRCLRILIKADTTNKKNNVPVCLSASTRSKTYPVVSIYTDKACECSLPPLVVKNRSHGEQPWACACSRHLTVPTVIITFS